MTASEYTSEAPRWWQPPAWWENPERQIARACTLWPGLELPPFPRDFKPSNSTEVPLLHVPGSFTTLWTMVSMSTKFSARRWLCYEHDERDLLLAPHVVEYDEPIWLWFDPAHAANQRPSRLWGRPGLAASEVLSALTQFPKWPTSWTIYNASVDLSGYQSRRHGNDELLVPHVSWVDHQSTLILGERYPDTCGYQSTSPTVRPMQRH